MNTTYCNGVLRPIPFTADLRSLYITLCIVNGFFSVIITVTNALIVLSMHKAASIRGSPSFLLIFTLALSDLGVGLIAEPLYIAARVAELQNSTGMFCPLSVAYNVAVVCLSGFSFLIITAISFDRFLAICLCMKYRSTVTRKRTTTAAVILMVIASLWAVSVAFSLTLTFYLSLFIMPSCIFVTTFNYLNISRMLKKQGKKFHEMGTENNQEIRIQKDAVDFDRYKHILNTVMFIYVAFLVSYLPYFSYLIARRLLGDTLVIHTARHVTASIIFLNSCLNPAFYFWRIPEIRKAVIRLVQRNSFNSVTEGKSATLRQLKPVM